MYNHVEKRVYAGTGACAGVDRGSSDAELSGAALFQCSGPRSDPGNAMQTKHNFETKP